MSTSPTMEPTLAELLADAESVIIPDIDNEWCNQRRTYKAALVKVLRAHADQAADARRLDWLESQATLHNRPDILYVVDGYEIEVVNESEHVLLHGQGADLRAAIASARQANKARLKTDAEARVHD